MESDSDAGTAWIQADLETVHLLISVTTQGRSDNDIWTTSYYISYGNDVNNLIDIDTLYTGNSDRNTKVTNLLPSGAFGRYIRLRPLGNNNSPGFAGIRWDVSGISAHEAGSKSHDRTYVFVFFFDDLATDVCKCWSCRIEIAEIEYWLCVEGSRPIHVFHFFISLGYFSTF